MTAILETYSLGITFLAAAVWCWHTSDTRRQQRRQTAADRRWARTHRIP